MIAATSKCVIIRSCDGMTWARRALHRWPILQRVAIVAIGACLVGGCGGTSARQSHKAEVHALALANAVCRKYYASNAGRGREQGGRADSGPVPFLAQRQAEFAKLRAVMSAVSELPGVGGYISDLAADDNLVAMLRRDVGRGYAAYLHVALSESYRQESRKLDAKVAADEKALGLTACIGPGARRPPIAG